MEVRMDKSAPAAKTKDARRTRRLAVKVASALVAKPRRSRRRLAATGRSVTVVQAKAAFSDCIRQVEAGTFVTITRHGKAVAAMIRPGDLEQLKRLRQAGPEGGLASLAGGWEGSDELVKILDESPRRGQRDVPDIEP
jgi:prevent-host-death family protein